MTTERNIIIHQGQAFELSLDYAGAPGRAQRMHIRMADGTATIVQALSHNGAANARVIYNDSTQQLDIIIGATVSAAWVVLADRVEWTYDIEDYDPADEDDTIIPYRGKTIVRGNRTRPEDATLSPQMPNGDSRYTRFDGEQNLTPEQMAQAQINILGEEYAPGGGSGDVVGPASATDDRIAAFDGVTGKLIKQGGVTATAVASHMGSTSNPHSVTAAQAGADPTGTAAAAVVAHTGATDPHGDRAFATSAVSTHSALTTGAHGITAAGAALLDDADAAAQRTTLGLGTAALSATGDFETAGAVRTHDAVTTAHGISAYGATLVDDADAATARSTLGLGTAATTAATDYATAGHNHSGVYQPSDAELTAIAGLTSAADSAPYFTGSGTAALMTVTAAGRALIDDADASAQRSTLGLTALATTTPGTGVATALAVNVGSAGAVVTNGGALGTPSSATLTNATGLPPAGITQSGATSNQVLAWNGSAWAPATPSGGLSEPLTAPRFTRQSSALTAAASGETKFQFRDMVRAAFAAVRATNDANELVILPDYTHPGLTGWHWSITTFIVKNVTTISQSGYTAGTTLLNSIGAGNFATAASANASSIVHTTSAWLRDGSSNGDGYIQWGLVNFPDSSYGSGATGFKVNLGAWATSGITANGNRPSGRSATLEFNTNQSDTNWQLCVYDTTLETVDTGLAFAAEKTYFWMIHLPRGGSAVYAYIKEIGGSSGSAVSTKTPGSTAMFSAAQVHTLTTTARNLRIACQWNYIPLEL